MDNAIPLPNPHTPTTYTAKAPIAHIRPTTRATYCKADTGPEDRTKEAAWQIVIVDGLPSTAGLPSGCSWCPECLATAKAERRPLPHFGIGETMTLAQILSRRGGPLNP